MRSVILLMSLLSLGPAALVACGSAHVPAPHAEEAPDPAPPPPDFDHFSAERAFEDLEALAAIGPRISGTEGSQRARALLRSELAKMGIEAQDLETLRQVEGREDAPLHHLSVTLPGASPALFVLAAPYDSSRLVDFDSVGANDGASGAALLLELARVLSRRSLPYTTRLLFLDGEGGVEATTELPSVARWSGSEGVARRMAETGELDRVRLVVAFHRICGPDLRVARDLSSHRMYREEFFRAADRSGHGSVFPRDQGFESVEGGHLIFRDLGVRGVVVLTDSRYGGISGAALDSESRNDTVDGCSSESLGAVGATTLEALDTIGARLAKIDRFARTPTRAPETEDASSAAEPPTEDASSPAEPPTEDASSPAEPPTGGPTAPADPTDPWQGAPSSSETPVAPAESEPHPSAPEVPAP